MLVRCPLEDLVDGTNVLLSTAADTDACEGFNLAAAMQMVDEKGVASSSCYAGTEDSICTARVFVGSACHD